MERRKGDTQMARIQVIVVDSSVAVKWFSQEDKTAEALSLRNSHVEGTVNLGITPLLYCEVANALRYKPDYDEKKLAKALRYLFNLHLNVAPIDFSLLSRAGEIAYDGDVTVYDALPVALAKSQKTVCITADEEAHYRKLKPKNYPIELL